MRTKELSIADGFALYLKSKQHLRPDSIRDIRCIWNRLLRTKPEFGGRNFSELSVSECEEWLNAAFHTDSQFKRSANEISPQAKDPKGETLCVCKGESNCAISSYGRIGMPTVISSLMLCVAQETSAKT